MTNIPRVKDEAALHIQVLSVLFCLLTYLQSRKKVLKIESINIVDK